MQRILADEILPLYSIDGTLMEITPYGEGHINETFAVRYRMNDGTMRRFLVQRINTRVFHDPRELMQNVVHITEYLRARIAGMGEDPSRRTLRFLFTAAGESFCTDHMGQYWRVSDFIEGTVTYQTAEKPENLYHAARAFGTFQKLMADYPADSLTETIPNFHNTPERFRQFEQAVAADVCGRAGHVQKEIAFLREREAFMHTLTDWQKNGEIPLRVTHNDTKLNNVLMDAHTGKGLCVVDLDTVMPGLTANDYGDAIRFGASTAPEDERDLDRVRLDPVLFEAFTRGFLECVGDCLSPRETESLPIGARMMTLECGMRFLTDYLNGDVYFKIHRDGHNLDRARAQLKLAWEMEQQWDIMREIVERWSLYSVSGFAG